MDIWLTIYCSTMEYVGSSTSPAPSLIQIVAGMSTSKQYVITLYARVTAMTNVGTCFVFGSVGTDSQGYLYALTQMYTSPDASTTYTKITSSIFRTYGGDQRIQIGFACDATAQSRATIVIDDVVLSEA
jgi:hypothetical protein